MKNINILLLGFGFLMLLVSCENLLVKELELEDFDFEKQLVLNSTFHSKSDSIVAFISENFSILESEENVVFIDDAEVELFYEGAKIADLEIGADKRYYHYFENGERPAGEYEMVVNSSKYEEARAVTQIPADVEILDLKFIPDAGSDPLLQTTTSSVQFKIVDPPGKQYYSFEVFSNYTVTDTFIEGTDTFIYDQLLYIEPANTTDVNIETSNSGKVYLNDATFDGKEYFINLKFAVYGPIMDPSDLIGKLKLNFEILSEDFYNFNTSVDRYYRSAGFGLFSEPVTIHTNVENGLGIFAGVNRKVFEL